jgi:hypothetical protein
VLDFAGLDQILDRASNVFDRDVGIDAVLVVEIDRVDAQPAVAGAGFEPATFGL